MRTLVQIFECVACGQRCPIMPYYPYAAPHGPNKDCDAPLGWRVVKELYPPTSG